jgi:hypothetical protein
MGEEVAAREGKDWRSILVAELERRITEVNATGQQLWCQDQIRNPGQPIPVQTERLSHDQDHETNPRGTRAAWLSQT